MPKGGMTVEGGGGARMRIEEMSFQSQIVFYKEMGKNTCPQLPKPFLKNISRWSHTYGNL